MSWIFVVFRALEYLQCAVELGELQRDPARILLELKFLQKIRGHLSHSFCLPFSLSSFFLYHFTLKCFTTWFLRLHKINGRIIQLKLNHSYWTQKDITSFYYEFSTFVNVFFKVWSVCTSIWIWYSTYIPPHYLRLCYWWDLFTDTKSHRQLAGLGPYYCPTARHFYRSSIYRALPHQITCIFMVLTCALHHFTFHYI